MRICVAGAYGAFGLKHLDALKNIEDLEVVSVMGPNIEKIAALAHERHIEHYSDSLEECISLQNVSQSWDYLTGTNLTSISEIMVLSPLLSS